MWRKTVSSVVGSDIAERIDIATRKDETCNLTIAFYNPTTGQPFDLTGYTFELSIDNNSNNVLTATTGTGLTIAAPASGVISVGLSIAQMGFPAGNYTYRLTATNLTSTKTWLQGIVYQVEQNQLQPAATTLKVNGQTYIYLNGKDILTSITNS